jgi:hypothetical protein
MGEEIECIEEVPFILNTLQHTPSCDGVLYTVGVIYNPEEEEECPCAEDNGVAAVLAEINSEIESIRLHYDPNYDVNYFPFGKYEREFNDRLINRSVSIDEIPSNTRIGPFKVINDPDIHQVRSIQCAVCNDRVTHASHTVSGRLDQFSTEKGNINTQTKILNRRLRKHVNGRFHYEPILYKIKKDKSTLVVNSGKSLSEHPQDTKEGFGVCYGPYEYCYLELPKID